MKIKLKKPEEEVYYIGQFQFEKIDFYYMFIQNLLIEAEKTAKMTAKTYYNNGLYYKGGIY